MHIRIDTKCLLALTGRNLNYPNQKQGVRSVKKTTQTTLPLRRTQRDRSNEVR